MTGRQIKIQDSALDLFSKQGYSTTPTIEIARKAGVSEGLIFRHYKNKQGLLGALLKEADMQIGELYSPILFETSPRKAIRRFIKLPYRLEDKRTRSLLKLRATFAWETGVESSGKKQALVQKLTVAFLNLRYKDPENEALFLYHVIDRITQDILHDKASRSNEFRDFLLKKYKVHKN